MGCSGSGLYHVVEEGESSEETCVRWRNQKGVVSKQTSIGMQEPRLSFHSMEAIEIEPQYSQHYPPMQRTHDEHVARLDRYVKLLDPAKVEKDIRRKLAVHEFKQEILWGKGAADSLVVVRA